MALFGPDEGQVIEPRRPSPGKRSLPGQEGEVRQEELAGPRRQGPGKRSLLGRLSRSTKAPAGGARRDGQAKAPQEKPAAALRAPRQGLTNSKLSGAARQLPRQATCRGKPPHQACAPAHLPTRHSGASPEARGGAPRSLRRAVACDVGRVAPVASGGAPNGLPRYCSCDPDGHFIILS